MDRFKGVKGFFAGWVVVIVMVTPLGGIVGLSETWLSEWESKSERYPDSSREDLHQLLKRTETAKDNASAAGEDDDALKLLRQSLLIKVTLRNGCWRTPISDKCYGTKNNIDHTLVSLAVSFGLVALGYPVVYLIILSFSYIFGSRKESSADGLVIR